MNNKEEGYCRCIRRNDKGFRYGHTYPYETVGDRYVVDDPPSYEWSFNSKAEFNKFFREGFHL